MEDPEVAANSTSPCPLCPRLHRLIQTNYSALQVVRVQIADLQKLCTLQRREARKIGELQAQVATLASTNTNLRAEKFKLMEQVENLRPRPSKENGMQTDGEEYPQRPSRRGSRSSSCKSSFPLQDLPFQLVDPGYKTASYDAYASDSGISDPSNNLSSAGSPSINQSINSPVNTPPIALPLPVKLSRKRAVNATTRRSAKKTKLRLEKASKTSAADEFLDELFGEDPPLTTKKEDSSVTAAPILSNSAAFSTLKLKKKRTHKEKKVANYPTVKHKKSKLNKIRFGFVNLEVAESQPSGARNQETLSAVIPNLVESLPPVTAVNRTETPKVTTRKLGDFSEIAAEVVEPLAPAENVSVTGLDASNKQSFPPKRRESVERKAKDQKFRSFHSRSTEWGSSDDPLPCISICEPNILANQPDTGQLINIESILACFRIGPILSPPPSPAFAGGIFQNAPAVADSSVNLKGCGRTDLGSEERLLVELCQRQFSVGQMIKPDFSDDDDR